MTDLSHLARQLRDIAEALDARAEPAHDPLTPHPDTLRIIASRHATRSQLNYSVPHALALQRRIRRYNADHGTQHGDIAALALDTWLRAHGYPPDPTPHNPHPAS